MTKKASDILDIDMPDLNIFISYWHLSPSVWVTLGVSWLVVVVSFVFSFEIPASGAVLVGGALVSEILFEQQRWRRLPCKPDGAFYLVSDSSTKKPIAQNEYCIAPAGSGKLGALLSLTSREVITVNKNRNEVTWYYRDIVNRIEKVFLIFIASTAILGTLLWGYGHRIF